MHSILSYLKICDVIIIDVRWPTPPWGDPIVEELLPEKNNLSASHILNLILKLCVSIENLVSGGRFWCLSLIHI